MSEKNLLGLSIIVAALVAGITGDTLLRATPWGANVLIWIIVTILSAAIVRALNSSEKITRRDILIIPLLCFAGMIAWRDSSVLLFLNIFGIVVTVAMFLLRSQGSKVLLSGIMDYVISIPSSAIHGILGTGKLIEADIEWKEMSNNKLTSQIGTVIKGIVIAIPLLFIFGALLSGADVAFANFLTSIFDLDFYEVALHTIIVLILSWLIAGYLRALFTDDNKIFENPKRPAGLWLGIVETSIVLSLLNLLFLLFVMVQFRYFFGGESRIQSVAGLTYAEYARSGFFELVWVAALMLPLLLVSHWLVRKDNPRNLMVYRILAGIQIALLFVMIVSALQRMRLYQSEYGLTELRVYTTAFMIWIAVIFLWFGATVLIGRRDRFAFGLIITGFLAIVSLNIINPDQLIVRTNIQRANADRPFDSEYAATLSADALPELIASIEKLKDYPLSTLSRRILNNYPITGNPGWRRWNKARSTALHLRIINDAKIKISACNVSQVRCTD